MKSKVEMKALKERIELDQRLWAETEKALAKIKAKRLREYAKRGWILG